MRIKSRVLSLLFALCAVGAAAAERDANDPELAASIEAALPGIIDIRHHLHANPELSNREFQTAKLVASHLRELGLSVTTGVAHTGVVALLEGATRGPVVAVRADMDALPVDERTDLPFRSVARGEHQGRSVPLAHACGHDIHVAVALGVAEVLAAHRDDLAGTVKFVFQPAEEGVPHGEEGGAPMMIDAGVLKDPAPSAMFALHSWPDYAVGEVAVTSGPAMASADRLLIDLHGRQSHGAYPHRAIDPIVLAAQVVLALQTIPSRSVDPLDAAVLSIGIVRGGERFNIIPQSVHLEGTVRTFSEAVQDTIEQRTREIVEGLTSSSGASYELEYLRENPYLNNDPALSSWAEARLVEDLGRSKVIPAPPVMAAEDFAWFAREIPGFYFRLGVVAPGTRSGALHTPDFRADDTAIEVGIRAMTRLVLDYLEDDPLAR